MNPNFLELSATNFTYRFLKLKRPIPQSSGQLGPQRPTAGLKMDTTQYQKI